MFNDWQKTIKEFQVPIIISDDTVEVVENPSVIDFGTGINVTDNGDGTVTIDASSGSGITSVGDVTSGAAFDGTQGTTLTFFNAGGNATLDYDANDFEFSDNVKLADNLKLKFGNSSNGNIQYDGTDLIISPAAVGSGDLEIRGNLRLESDSDKLFFGAGKDASIQYNGSTLILDPQEVGSGGFRVKGQTFIDGVNDETQLRVQSNGTQTANLATFEENGGAKLVIISAGGDVELNKDNSKVLWGAGQDASILYDGSHMVFDSQEVGTGNYLFDGGGKIIINSVATTTANAMLDIRSNATGTRALQLRGSLGQVSDIFNVISSTGSELFDIDDDGSVGITTDNAKLYLGTSKDASLTYDGTDLIINPREVGSGSIRLSSGDGVKTFWGSGKNASIYYNSVNLVLDAAEVGSGLLDSKTDILVPDEAYGIAWNGSLEVPTKNSLYDKIEAVGTIGSGTTGQIPYYAANGAVLTATSSVFITASGNVAMGATTADTALEVIGDITSKGTEWTSRTSVVDNTWSYVTYGNGFFVAVSASGIGNRVMTSPDGVNWTSRTSAADNNWQSITYANGLFVATADSGVGNRVMTSPDGITWTSRTSATDNQWQSVTYGDGLFVAVSFSGFSNLVMTSPDGINWTSRIAAVVTSWKGVTYGDGLFVAVANFSFFRVMTSPDGINWTSRSPASQNPWTAVTYGNGLFVAVANNAQYGPLESVMTSPDGITWTSRTAAVNTTWVAVTYGNGLFVATAASGQVMTSPNGIDWTSRTAATANQWMGVTYGNGIFVSVSQTGTGDRVMTSGKTEINEIPEVATGGGGAGITAVGDVGTGAAFDGTQGTTLTFFDASGNTTQAYDGSEMVFNDAGSNIDFRVETNNDANSLVVNGFNDNTGLGTASPQYKLHVYDTGAAFPRMYFQGDTGSAPGIMMGFDSSATQATILRANEEGSGTNFSLYTRNSAGSAFVNSIQVEADGDAKFMLDNQKVFWGAGQDSSINYDGTDLQINPAEVGSGKVVISSGLEIPNSASPTVNANGEIAFDTTVTSFSTGLLKFFGNEEQGVVSMPIAQFTTPTDGHVVSYNATNDEFELVAGGGGGGGGDITSVGDVISGAAFDGTQGTTLTFFDAGGNTTQSYDGSEMVFNDAGADIDFRIEGSTEDNLFFVDAGSDSVGIGTNTPTEFLSVRKDQNAQTLMQFRNDTVGTAASAGFRFEADNQLVTGQLAAFSANYITTQIAKQMVVFSGTTTGVGLVMATASTDGKLQFKTQALASVDKMTIVPAGRVGINEVSPDAMLEVASNGSLEEALHLKMAAASTAKTLLITDSTNATKAFHILDETDSGEPENALVIGSSSLSNPANVIEARRDIEGVASGESVSGAQRGAYFTIANSKVTNVTSGQTALARFVFFSDGTVGGGVNSSGELGNIGFSSSTNDGTSMIFANRTQADTANIRFVTRDGGRKPLTLLGNGLVGINEIAPDSELEVVSRLSTTPTLHIKGASSQTADLFNATDNADTSLVTIDASGDLALTQDNGKALFGAGKDASILYDGSDMVFDSQEVGSGNYLFAGGNVGIGTVAPTTKLEVVGDITSKGTSWTSRTTPVDDGWLSITYGNGLFVAISFSGTDRVMTSPDGVNWTIRTSPADNEWRSVTYGNGLFVSVGHTGTGDQVMTSPDGVNWTSRTASVGNDWASVTYGNGLFVAVSNSGTGDRVMTSPDGITWTTRTSAADLNWSDVIYGNGLFVSVAHTGTGNRVMTSPDGSAWSIGVTPADNDWVGITYGNGLFVAVSSTGTNDRIMTSPDGSAWTLRTSPVDNNWVSVTYGNGLFVAVAYSGISNRVMTSPDGINWITRTSVVDNQWLGIAYGNGIFVTVSDDGTNDQAMTSGKTEISALVHNNTFQGGMNISGDVVISDSLEIPNGAAPVVDADGEIAFDNTVTDFSTGLLKFFGNEEQGVVSMPIAQFTSPVHGRVVTYNGTNDEFELASSSGITDVMRADALVSFNTADVLVDLDTAITALEAFPLAGDQTQTTSFTNQVLAPGVWNFAPAITITPGANPLEFNGGGDPNALWIIRTTATATFGASMNMTLTNGAKAENIFWIAGGAISVLAGGTVFGNLISKASTVTVGSGCTIVGGRVLTKAGAVSMTLSTISKPTAVSPHVSLGIAETFVAYTGAGGMTNIGASVYTGDIASNNTAPAGFVSATIIGTLYSPGITAAIADDYSPSETSNPLVFVNAEVVIVTTTSSATITGFDETGFTDGQQFVLLNGGAGDIVLKNNNSGSAIDNRIVADADVTLKQYQSREVMRVEGALNKWVLIGN